VVLATLAAWEGLWRAKGFAPAAKDNAALWARERARVSSGDPATLVFLGSSIIQAAVDLDHFAQVAGGPKPIQLGLTGSSPLPVLEDLATDPAFVGVAVVEFSPIGLFDGTGSVEQLPREMLAHSRGVERGLFRRVEGALVDAVDDHAVFRLSMLAPTALLRFAATGSRPIVDPLHVARDRSLEFDWSRPRARVPPALGRAALGRAPVLRGPDLETVVDRLASAASSIGERDGTVLFLAFECQGPYRKQVASRYPLARYWPLVKRVPALRVDLTRSAGLRAIRCPDGVHLDLRDRAQFSQVLAREIRARVGS
jgi:hypothetical protein